MRKRTTMAHCTDYIEQLPHPFSELHEIVSLDAPNQILTLIEDAASVATTVNAAVSAEAITLEDVAPTLRHLAEHLRATASIFRRFREYPLGSAQEDVA